MTADPKDAKGVQIFIDKSKFNPSETNLTGSQLRALPVPPIGPERDLWIEAPGPDPDRRIEGEERVKLRNGMHFYTTPGAINPGS